MRTIHNPLFILGLVATLGCGKADETNSSKTETAKVATPVTNENAEKPRLVVVGGVITETLFAMGMGDAVVGVDSSSTFPESAASIAQVGSHHHVAIEGVMALRPTHVLAIESTPPKIIEQLKSAGAKVTSIGEAKSLDQVPARIEAVAKAVGQAEEGAKLAAETRTAIDSARNTPPKSKAKILFVYARGSRVLSVAGSDTAADAMIRAAGYENAAKELSGFMPLNAEAVAKAAPDVLLMMKSGASSLESQGGVFTLPGISLTPAGQKKRLVEMDGLFLLGLGPRTGEAISALQAAVDTQLAAQ